MHTLIFDIGKTNKKVFVFDKKYQQIHREYVRYDPVPDEDGYPSDDLSAIVHWIKNTFNELTSDNELEIESVNFSTYGATLVHLDRDGRPITPLYNYTKPYPKYLLDEFYRKYGDKMELAKSTATPPSGMLNVGLQLYWLKYTRPHVFEKVRYSLHFPQYLSYLFTGIPVSDFTSLGCHTGLWDFGKDDYHDWVFEEGFDRVLAPIVSTGTSINVHHNGNNLRIGVGIHDSSASLIPYVRAEKKSFVLISTGTWSISLNPFCEEELSFDDLENDCLQYMRIDGQPVMASRLFLGNEYKIQVEELCSYFHVEYGYHRSVQFDEDLYHREIQRKRALFCFKTLNTNRNQPPASRLDAFDNFESAFHRLMIELMELQLESTKRVIGSSRIKKIYIDGGFADNDIFIKLASLHFKDYKLRTTKSPLGSSLGAAMVISDKKVKSKFLKKHYAMRKHEPLILAT